MWLDNSNRCLFRPMWPVQSWISSEAWACVRSVTSCSHFLEGVVLSIVCCLRYLGNAFQHHSHFCWILAFWSWCNTEILWGNVFLSSFGSKLLALGYPLVAFFASTSAFSFGVKSTWPSIHWNLRLTTPHVLTVSWLPARWALWNSIWFCSLSCFSCNFSTAAWMWSSR